MNVKKSAVDYYNSEGFVAKQYEWLGSMIPYLKPVFHEKSGEILSISQTR